MSPGRLVGRVAAWTAFVVLACASAVQLIVPLTGRLAANLTWSRDELVACRESAEPCVASTVTIDSSLAWIGLGGPVMIAVAIIVCWSPLRWWVGPGMTRPARPGVFSTPEWFRLLGFAALLLNACGLIVVGNRWTGVWMLEYLWALAASVGVIVLATASIHSSAGRIDDETRALLVREFPFWITRREAALRAGAAVPARGRTPAAGSRRAAREGGSDHG